MEFDQEKANEVRQQKLKDGNGREFWKKTCYLKVKRWMSTNIREIEVQNFCEDKLTTQNSTKGYKPKGRKKREKRENLSNVKNLF